MAAIVLLLAVLAMANSCSGATWCICRTDVSDASLQKTLDYACGAGADCNPILQNGVCFNPNTVRSHCSYAVNSYFQRRGQAQGTCDFAGTATAVTTDPSPSTTCSFPSSGSSTGTPGTAPPTTTTPGISPPTTTTPGISPPTTTTPGISPPSGIIGGTGTSLGPTGVIPDANGAFHPKAVLGSFIPSLLFSFLFVLRG